MQVLSQNSKMRKSRNEIFDVYNFGIPAFRSETGLETCPNARHCVSGCYARSGTYRFKNVVNSYEQRLKLTQSLEFRSIMRSEVNSKTFQSKAKGKQCLIRIHDSGDFYSKEYADAWLDVILSCPDTQFYAYTKMVSLFNDLYIPSNFTVIYSFGGSEDHLIDPNRDRHSKVFQNETDLILMGYVDASQNDLVAIGVSKRIGLIYHGTKNYTNTSWSKVS